MTDRRTMKYERIVEAEMLKLKKRGESSVNVLQLNAVTGVPYRSINRILDTWVCEGRIKEND